VTMIRTKMNDLGVLFIILAYFSTSYSNKTQV